MRLPAQEHQTRFLLRAAPNKPNRPEPNNQAAAGIGTGLGFWVQQEGLHLAVEAAGADDLPQSLMARSTIQRPA